MRLPGHALLLAPMQFSDRPAGAVHQAASRRGKGLCWWRADRGAARLFTFSIMRNGWAVSRSFSLAAAMQATIWIVTTLVAMLLIWNGKVDAHRRWMTRSFSVALVFLEVRVIDGVTGWERPRPRRHRNDGLGLQRLRIAGGGSGAARRGIVPFAPSPPRSRRRQGQSAIADRTPIAAH